MSEANKSIFRRFVDEVINRGDLGAVDELLAEEYTEHSCMIPGLPGGREGAKQQFALLHAAFPDLSVTLEDAVAEDDRVASRSTWRATHRGELLGLQATGQALEFSQLEIVRIRKGRIAERWGSTDPLSLRQLLERPAVAMAPPD